MCDGKCPKNQNQIGKYFGLTLSGAYMCPTACPPAVRQESDNTLNLLDVDFWLWYQKVTPKGMAHAFRIRFWEMFNASRMYDILTDN